MSRQIDLNFNVQLTPEQMELAREVVNASNRPSDMLQRNGASVDWEATGTRLIEVTAHVYCTLLLMQAKREARGILYCSEELARERRKMLDILDELTGSKVTPDQLLAYLSAATGISKGNLRALLDPIRRDLDRLQGGGSFLQLLSRRP